MHPPTSSEGASPSNTETYELGQTEGQLGERASQCVSQRVIRLRVEAPTMGGMWAIANANLNDLPNTTGGNVLRNLIIEIDRHNGNVKDAESDKAQPELI